MDEARLDYRRLKNSTVPIWLGLVIGGWVGLIWGSIITMPIGVGFGVMAGSAMGGFLAVPAWGTVFGLMGLGGQRNAALRERGFERVKDNHPLVERTNRLCSRLGMEHQPWVATMPHNNAYAIGSSPKKALVVVGKPLLDDLTPDEVDAIIGHELGHIANNDMRRMGFARSFQNSLVWYLGFSSTLQGWARGILTWASELMVMGLSRKREFWADAIGASLTSPQHMISALKKLHEGPALSKFEKQNARLMFRGRVSGLLSTHPTLEERVNALETQRYIKRLPHRKPSKPVAPKARKPAPLLEDISYAKAEKTRR